MSKLISILLSALCIEVNLLFNLQHKDPVLKPYILQQNNVEGSLPFFPKLLNPRCWNTAIISKPYQHQNVNLSAIYPIWIGSHKLSCCEGEKVKYTQKL